MPIDFQEYDDKPTSDGIDFQETPQSQPAPDTSKVGVLAGDDPLKDVKEAIPFNGAIDEAKEGYGRGVQLAQNLGLPDIVGKDWGTIFGAARAAGTALNPIGKLISGAKNAIQGNTEFLGGGMDKQAAQYAAGSYSGSRPILPTLKTNYTDTGHPLVDVPVNTIKDVWNQVRKSPEVLTTLDVGGLSEASKATAAKKYQMGPETGSPLINTKVIPDKSGSHYVEPHEVFDDSNEKLLARIAPDKGAPKNHIKVSEARKNGFIETFRINPDETKDGAGVLQTIADNAPEIYKRYQDIGMSRPDVQIPTDSIKAKLQKSLGEAPGDELQSLVANQTAAYPENISLPGAIQKLEQVNSQLGPLIQKGDTGLKYRVLSSEATALRDVIDPKIEEVGGTQASKLRTTYGNMTELAKSLGKQMQKNDANIPAKLRGSFHDLVGTIEMLGGALSHGVNPMLTTAMILDGFRRAKKANAKLFATDTDAMIGKLNKNLSKQIDIKPTEAPEGFLPNPNFKGPSLSKDQVLQFMQQYGSKGPELTPRPMGGKFPPYEGENPNSGNQPTSSPPSGPQAGGTGQTARGSPSEIQQGPADNAEPSQSVPQAPIEQTPEAHQAYLKQYASDEIAALDAQAKSMGLKDHNFLSQKDPKTFEKLLDDYEKAHPHPPGYLGLDTGFTPEDLSAKIREYPKFPSKPKRKS